MAAKLLINMDMFRFAPSFASSSKRLGSDIAGIVLACSLLAVDRALRPQLDSILRAAVHHRTSLPIAIGTNPASTSEVNWPWAIQHFKFEQTNPRSIVRLNVKDTENAQWATYAIKMAMTSILLWIKDSEIRWIQDNNIRWKNKRQRRHPLNWKQWYPPDK